MSQSVQYNNSNEIAAEIGHYIEKGVLTSNYKPILWQAIMHAVKGNKFAMHKENILIPLDEIANYFIRFNFVLLRRFKLRLLQSKINRTQIQRIIDQYFPETESPKLELKEKEITPAMRTEVITLLHRNVIWALRKDLYLYELFNYKSELLPLKREIKDEQDYKQNVSYQEVTYIGISQIVKDYILTNFPVLEHANLALLSDFLDGINIVPKLYSKLLIAAETFRKNRNIDPKKKQKLYEYQQNHCFYCDQDMGETPHADHFIPYDYILDSPIWNMVGACVRCNLKKSDRLVNTDTIKKLQFRNNDSQFQSLFANEMEEKEEIQKQLEQHFYNCGLYFHTIKHSDLIS